MSANPPCQHKLNLQSSPGSIAHVEPFIKGIATEFNIPADVYGNMLISLTEAVANAIFHGNKTDNSKSVTIEMIPLAKPTTLTFRISDQGSGFDINNVPDPTTPDNLLKCGGRGVFLMRKLSDRIKFYDNGRTVEIQFNV
jgi:serine/threonine-protein kinase RsbW